MKIKEKYLISLGFERVDVSEEESCGKPFYYYTIDFGKSQMVSLISLSSDEVVDNDWTLSIFEDETIVIKNLDELCDFVNLIKKLEENYKQNTTK